MTEQPTFNVNASYKSLLGELKERVRTAQIKASLAVNSELIAVYWYLGKRIHEEQRKHQWGSKFIEQVARDLKSEFPDMKGFSPRNIQYIRQFFIRYKNESEFVQHVAAQIPWGHQILLLDKVKNLKEAIWYTQQTIENGWSRNVLAMQIQSNLYARQQTELKQTNFAKTLPKLQSDLAENTVKDPYIFDFLSVGKGAHEREIETELTTHIRKFLLELGQGFAFVGNQYHLEVGDQDFYVDMLFYHLGLRCYVVIELKTKKFKPEYAGKLNFYLSVIDDLLKRPEDNPTIGLLLCQDKNQLVSEYSLKDMKKPIGVSEYQIIESLPEILKAKLPSIEEIESEFNDDKKRDPLRLP